jgi:hypothetical protein
MEINSIKLVDVDTAVRFYKAHLKAVSEYQKRNLDKMRTKNKAFNEKIKVHDKEKYERYLAKKREHYYNVRKPKREAEKLAKNSIAHEESKNEISQT